MSRVIALIRVRALTASSYRLQLVLSVASLLVGIVPLYFIAGALQPLMEESIRPEGGHYFGFILVGIVSLQFLSSAVSILPGEFGSELRTGTLEAVLGTPTRLWEILLGMIGWGLVWTTLRGLILLVAGWAMGAEIVWAQLPVALAVIVLLVLAYLPFAMIGSAAVMIFRTAGPLGTGIIFISTMLGGTYYPTRVIPAWLQDISALIPLTYGLRALRQLLLEGGSVWTTLSDLSVLLGFVVVLMIAGTIALHYALCYARRRGTLAQY